MILSSTRIPYRERERTTSVSSAAIRTPATSGDMKQKIQRDGSAQNFGQVAGGNRSLAKNPQRQIDRTGITVAAGLRQIPAGGDAQPGRQRLQQNRHDIRQHQHPKQPVSEASTAFDVRCPVARIHVSDAHQIRRTGECQEAPPAARSRYRNGRCSHCGCA